MGMVLMKFLPFVPSASLDLAPPSGYSSYMTVGVRELKNSLSRYLERAKRGEEIIVTERGRPVAFLKRIQSAEPSDSLEARLAKAAAEGKLILPGRKPLNRVRKIKVRGALLSRVVLEDRR